MQRAPCGQPSPSRDGQVRDGAGAGLGPVGSPSLSPGPPPPAPPRSRPPECPRRLSAAVARGRAQGAFVGPTGAASLAGRRPPHLTWRPRPPGPGAEHERAQGPQLVQRTPTARLSRHSPRRRGTAPEAGSYLPRSPCSRGSSSSSTPVAAAGPGVSARVCASRRFTFSLPQAAGSGDPLGTGGPAGPDRRSERGGDARRSDGLGGSWGGRVLGAGFWGVRGSGEEKAGTFSSRGSRCPPPPRPQAPYCKPPPRPDRLAHRPPPRPREASAPAEPCPPRLPQVGGGGEARLAHVSETGPGEGEGERWDDVIAS
ncbi:basic proline-rich protein-like [Lepus europaeus]|uniref:basic proline-rich protein-like n=1 Tax=Lepus europaeus TaxID=9983 RepID=UPI002B46D8E1|nr:basic proline-rich protein-like [Lepus europaeus]